jgi:hypothetical protein
MKFCVYCDKPITTHDPFCRAGDGDGHLFSITRYTQSDLDAAIAQAVRERTVAIYELLCHPTAHRIPKISIEMAYPDCFEENTP